jgi:hypothetical protein
MIKYIAKTISSLRIYMKKQNTLSTSLFIASLLFTITPHNAQARGELPALVIGIICGTLTYDYLKEKQLPIDIKMKNALLVNELFPRKIESEEQVKSELDHQNNIASIITNSEYIHKVVIPCWVILAVSLGYLVSSEISHCLS